MTSYKTLAEYYDQIMGDRKVDGDFIMGVLNKNNPKSNTLLELGCGTGTFLNYFHDKGFAVSGVDLSQEMLDIAQKKNPGACLYKDNMSNFNIAEQFDVIVCLFDSVNHLLNLKEWELMFKNVGEHLNENGLFIFDMNTQYKLEKLSTLNDIVHIIDENKKIHMKVTLNKGVYDWEIKIIDTQEGFESVVSNEIIQEVSFSVLQVQKILNNYFSQVTLFTKDNKDVDKATKRVYFLCQI